MTAEQKVTRSVEVPAGVERVWEAISDPRQLARWLGADQVEIDLRPGGEGLVREAGGAGRRVAVEDVQPGRRLAFHWWPADSDGLTPADAGATTVDIVVTPLPDGSRVTVTETALTAMARPRPAAVAA